MTVLEIKEEFKLEKSSEHYTIRDRENTFFHFKMTNHFSKFCAHRRFFYESAEATTKLGLFFIFHIDDGCFI